MTTQTKTQASAPADTAATDAAPVKMKLRVFKMGDAEYDAAMTAAKSEGDALAEVIRHSLATYVARIERKQAARAAREKAGQKRSKARKAG